MSENIHREDPYLFSENVTIPTKIFKGGTGWVPTLIKPNLIKTKSHKTITYKKYPSLINFVHINL